MTNSFDGDAWGKLFAEEVKSFVQDSAKKIKDDLRTEFEARFAELEKCPVKFVGVYSAGKTYEQNELVTHSGSLWICKSTSSSRPGDDATFQLIVKQGTFK